MRSGKKAECVLVFRFQRDESEEWDGEMDAAHWCPKTSGDNLPEGVAGAVFLMLGRDSVERVTNTAAATAAGVFMDRVIDLGREVLAKSAKE